MLATANAKSDAIVFEDVAIAFEDKPVLDDISFRLPRGETKAIFGVAGSGKSTILKLALGLIRPDGGHIYTLGQDITQMKEEDLFELRRRIVSRSRYRRSPANSPSGMRRDFSMSLDDRSRTSYSLILSHPHICSAASIVHDDGNTDRRRFVELEHTLDMFPSELSGGMRRRVAIARAIITQPEVLLYDSPTGGLDPVTSTTIVELIVKQRDVYKTSALLVTHRLQDAFTMATHYFDRKTNRMEPLPPGAHGEVPMAFLFLRDGKIIFDGDLQELARTRDEYIREYIS